MQIIEENLFLNFEGCRKECTFECDEHCRECYECTNCQEWSCCWNDTSN